MKRLFTFILLFLATIGNAQTEEKAGLFNLFIEVDDEVKTESKVELKKGNFSSSFSTSEIMPDSLLELIKTTAVDYLSEYLDMDTELYYKVKDGKQKSTIGAGDELEGMPTNSLGNAIKMENYKRYVNINIKITGGGKAKVTLANNTFSRVKPKIWINVRVFDENKEVVAKEVLTIKDFGELKQKSKQQDNIIVTTAETLSPTDVYNMIILILESALLDLGEE